MKKIHLSVVSLAVMMLALSGCQTQPNNRPFPSFTSTVTPTALPTKEIYRTPTKTEVKTHEINVYFFDKKKFDIPDNTDYTSPIKRTSSREDIATFALEEIIKGPTAEEKTKYNLDSTFGENKSVWFTTKSNCNGKDFSITIDKGLATVKFCRQTALAGDMSGFIVEDQIGKTLKQFSTISEVKIRNVSGGCFNDMSGLCDNNK